MPWKQTAGGSGPHVVGQVPDRCDMCREIFDKKKPAYDAKTVKGPWGFLCPTCFRQYGIGLGIGLGQQYNWHED